MAYQQPDMYIELLSVFCSYIVVFTISINNNRI